MPTTRACPLLTTRLPCSRVGAAPNNPGSFQSGYQWMDPLSEIGQPVGSPHCATFGTWCLNAEASSPHGELPIDDVVSKEWSDKPSVRKLASGLNGMQLAIAKTWRACFYPSSVASTRTPTRQRSTERPLRTHVRPSLSRLVGRYGWSTVEQHLMLAMLGWYRYKHNCVHGNLNNTTTTMTRRCEHWIVFVFPHHYAFTQIESYIATKPVQRRCMRYSWSSTKFQLAKVLRHIRNAMT